MFVQTTKSARRNGKTYVSYLVRESFRTAEGPRSRTVCNITDLPPDLRDLIAASLRGQRFLPAQQVQLEAALDYGALAVLNDAWSRFGLEELLAGIGSARQRGLLQAIIYSRLLFPCPKLSLAQQAQGTWLASACRLAATETFDEDDLYEAMDQLNGHWVALEKQLYHRAFPQSVRLVLYDLTSVYFEGKGPAHLARYGHSRDHRADRLCKSSWRSGDGQRRIAPARGRPAGQPQRHPDFARPLAHPAPALWHHPSHFRL